MDGCAAAPAESNARQQYRGSYRQVTRQMQSAECKTFHVYQEVASVPVPGSGHVCCRLTWTAALLHLLNQTNARQQ
jgi:hypothetical protein